MALLGGNGLIILALGLTGALPAVGAFGGLGAVAFLGKLYCVFGKLALGSISLMRICLFMRQAFHPSSLTNWLASDHAALI